MRWGKLHNNDPSVVCNNCPRIVLSPLTRIMVGAHHWVMVIVRRPHDCLVNAIHALYQSWLTRYKGAPRNWDALMLHIVSKRRFLLNESRESRYVGKDLRQTSWNKVSSQTQSSWCFGLSRPELSILGLWRLCGETIAKVLLDLNTRYRCCLLRSHTARISLNSISSLKTKSSPWSKSSNHKTWLIKWSNIAARAARDEQAVTSPKSRGSTTCTSGAFVQQQTRYTDIYLQYYQMHTTDECERQIYAKSNLGQGAVNSGNKEKFRTLRFISHITDRNLHL